MKLVALRIRKVWAVLEWLILHKRFSEARRLLIMFCLESSIPRPPTSNCSFDLRRLSIEECSEHFRFTPEDILLLCDCLQVPHTIKSRCGTIVPQHEAMCIVLKRMAYSCRWSDLQPFFRRDSAVLSSVFNFLARRIVATFKHLLDFSCPCWTSEVLQSYEVAMQRHVTIPNAFGMLDGTCRQICRPKRNQGVYYNGKIRAHCIKFLAVTLPTGIVGYIAGPFAGIRHDSRMFSESLKPLLENEPFSTSDGLHALLADPGKLCIHVSIYVLSQNVVLTHRIPSTSKSHQAEPFPAYTRAANTEPSDSSQQSGS
jgi:hypothetical protein